MRDLEPLPGSGARAQVRRAGLGDIDEAVALSDGVARHLAGSPALVTDVGNHDRPFHEEWLAGCGNALGLAYDDSGAIGRLASGPPSRDA